MPSNQHIPYVRQAAAQVVGDIPLVEDTHSLKEYCGHFNTTHYLTIRKTSNFRPMDPGKRSCKTTPCAHPASCVPLGILHSPLWDVSSQDKHFISHSCHLKTWPMAFSRISSSLRQVFLLLKVTLRIRTWTGSIQCNSTSTSLTCHILLSHPMAQSDFCRPFPAMTAH